MGGVDDTHLENEGMLGLVSFHLCGSNLEGTELQRLLKPIDEDLHILVNRYFVTDAGPTVDEVRAVGPVEIGDNAGQEAPAETLGSSRCSPLVSIPTIPTSVRP